MRTAHDQAKPSLQNLFTSQSSNARAFFRVGTVFSVLWDPTLRRPNIKSVLLGEPIYGVRHYTELYMIVVKEEDGSCLCVPVQTYRGEGVCSPHLKQGESNAHSIVYLTNKQPARLAAEVLNKQPIAIKPANPNLKLDRSSRVNFAQAYSIQWYGSEHLSVIDTLQLTVCQHPLGQNM